MAESIFIDEHVTKAEKYEQLIPQIKSLVGTDVDDVAVLANVAAALHISFAFFWTGFYIVRQNQLILGPFQGPVACMSIASGNGVCGTAWKKNETQLVDNVEEFPGHIACSSESKSEIVVPLRSTNGEVRAVLDLDSEHLSNFDQIDKRYLEELCDWIGQHIY
jgi:L-methionine (R)-S-oxide reductase